MKSRVVKVDKGAKKLRSAVSAPVSRLKLGVFGDAAAQRAQDGNGPSVGDLFATHELGLGTVPERAPIRRYVDANKSRIAIMIRQAGELIASGKATSDQVLNLLGLKLAGEVREFISRGVPPALSARYLKRKMLKYPGATTPLIASGQMRGAISHLVVPGK